MKNFLRLLRYGLPYALEWLPGVILLAMVGALDTFRTLLFQPIFDQVLRPMRPRAPSFSACRTARCISTCGRPFHTSCICTTHGMSSLSRSSYPR